MIFIEVRGLPKRVGQTPNKRHDIRTFIDEFIEADIKYALVAWSDKEYKGVDVIRASISTCIKKNRISNVRVRRINNEIYLIRTDK